MQAKPNDLVTSPGGVPAAHGTPNPNDRAAIAAKQGVSLDSIPVAEAEQAADPRLAPHVAAAPRRTKVTLEEDPAEPEPPPNPYPSKPSHPETVQLEEAQPASPTKPAATAATAAAATDVSLDEQPAPPPKPEVPAGDRGPLNRGAALSALAAASGRATACTNPDGPSGSGRAMVTFSPDGPVTNVAVPAPFAGTPVGTCVSNAFRSARVPAFTGSSVTLPQSFRVP
jgi:hypothetical protein